MNITLLSSEIVSKVRNSMQDSALNQEIMVAGMIREASDQGSVTTKWLWKAMADQFPRTADKIVSEFELASATCHDSAARKKLELHFMYKQVFDFCWEKIKNE